MESISVRNVNDIRADDKRSLEDLLGQQLEANQQVFIMVLTPGVQPNELTREAAAMRIEKTLARVDANVSAENHSQAEIDAAVEEAMDHVRRRPA